MMLAGDGKYKSGRICFNPLSRRTEDGFTLLELFTVTFIIAILSAMSVMLVARAKSQAREVAALSCLNEFTAAYEMYHFRYKKYPHWGPGQEFDDPRNLIDFFIAEGFLPSVTKRNYEYFPDFNLFRGFTEDYYLQIPAYDPDADEPLSAGSYIIILVPSNFQRSYLAAIFDPINGAVTVRARKGDITGALASYKLFTFKDPPVPK